MKQSNEVIFGKQPTKRGASNGEKVNSFGAAMDSGTDMHLRYAVRLVSGKTWPV